MAQSTNRDESGRPRKMQYWRTAIVFNQTGQIATQSKIKQKVNIDWPSSLADWFTTLWVQVPQGQVSPYLPGTLTCPIGATAVGEPALHPPPPAGFPTKSLGGVSVAV